MALTKWFFHSVTVALSYVLAAVGLGLDIIFQAQDFMPDVKTWVSEVFKDHPGPVIAVIGGLVFVARFRSIWKGMQK
jgi:hypothetical protein